MSDKIPVNTPDTEDPFDFSDFEPAIKQAEAMVTAKRVTLRQLAGFEEIEDSFGKKWLVRHPKAKQRLDLEDALKAFSAVPAEEYDSKAGTIASMKLVEPFLYLPSSDGQAPRKATLDEVMTDWDVTDVDRIFDAINPKSAAEEVADSGGDPKDAETTETTGPISLA